MTTTTNAFCERCGTSTVPAAPPPSGLPALVGRVRSMAGLDNSVVDDGLRLCLGCRGYVCAACMNDAAGMCVGCEPLAGEAPTVDAPVVVGPLVVAHSQVVAEPPTFTDRPVDPTMLGEPAWPLVDQRPQAGHFFPEDATAPTAEDRPPAAELAEVEEPAAVELAAPADALARVDEWAPAEQPAAVEIAAIEVERLTELPPSLEDVPPPPFEILASAESAVESAPALAAAQHVADQPAERPKAQHRSKWRRLLRNPQPMEVAAPPAYSRPVAEVVPPAAEPAPPAAEPAPVEAEPRAAEPATVEVAPPVEEPATVEVTPPVEMPSPVEVAAPAAEPATVEVTPPVAEPAPVEVTPPVAEPAPAEVTPPGRLVPVQPRPPRPIPPSTGPIGRPPVTQPPLPLPSMTAFAPPLGMAPARPASSAAIHAHLIAQVESAAPTARECVHCQLPVSTRAMFCRRCGTAQPKVA